MRMNHLLELEYRPNGDDSEIYRATLSLKLPEQYFGLYETASVRELASDPNHLSVE